MIDLKLNVSTFKYLCCSIMLAGASSILVTIYRPGSQPTSVKFYEEFAKLLERLAGYSLPVTFTRVLNVHFEKEADTDACKLTEMLASFVLNQFVNTSAHKLWSILDVVVAPEDYPPKDIAVDTRSTCCLWRGFKSEEFIRLLESSVLYKPDDRELDIDRLAVQYSSTITDLLDKMAPLKAVTVREQCERPWHDDDCHTSRREFKAKKMPESRVAWRDALKQEIGSIQVGIVLQRKINAAGSSAHRFWRTVDNLLGHTKCDSKCSFSPTE